jgi:hypothetical protein
LVQGFLGGGIHFPIAFQQECKSRVNCLALIGFFLQNKGLQVGF